MELTHEYHEYHGYRIPCYRIPYRMGDDPMIKRIDVYNWCVSQFGEVGVRWLLKGFYVYFRDETDLTWFLLKWG